MRGWRHGACWVWGITFERSWWIAGQELSQCLGRLLISEKTNTSSVTIGLRELAAGCGSYAY